MKWSSTKLHSEGSCALSLAIAFHDQLIHWLYVYLVMDVGSLHTNQVAHHVGELLPVLVARRG